MCASRAILASRTFTQKLLLLAGIQDAQSASVDRLPGRVQVEREYACLRAYWCRTFPDTSPVQPHASLRSGPQGKTDVALLTILRCLSNLAGNPLTSMSDPPKLPPASAYKIVYVAPLKALAAEVTQKFAKRLAWAGVKVRELTGDMKLTKKEIDETGVIVTTPEKWDVVTRKGAGSGDGEVAEVRSSGFPRVLG